MTEFILEMENVSKTFPGVKALNNVQLNVKIGEVHALIGENGAGKSTLIKILAGIYKPDAGARFTFEGQEINIQKPLDATLKGISVIYQDLSLFPNLSVAENIYIGHDSGKKMFSKIKWKKIRTLAKKALEELEFDVDLDMPVEKLSIAQQQLIEIARALVFDSKLIIMDEPTSSLSDSEVEKLYKIINKMKAKGISVIFISHKLKELFKVSDRFTVLRDGQWVGTYEASELDEEQLVKLMVGRNVQYDQLQEKVEVGEELLRVENLSKFGNFKDISFSLYKGEVLGITGLVGSGRSELMQAIFGVNLPYTGEIYLNGEKLNIKNSEMAVKKGIAYVPESRKTHGIVGTKSNIDNISLPSLKNFRSKFGLINRKKEIEIAEKYIEELDVRPAIVDRETGQLSGGNQQKIVISKWLATKPKILIIDEPTNGIDIGAKTEIHKLLRNLAKQNIGVIVVSSELPEVLAVCDRIIVMKNGVIKGELISEKATQENIMSYALGNKS